MITFKFRYAGHVGSTYSMPPEKITMKYDTEDATSDEVTEQYAKFVLSIGYGPSSLIQSLRYVADQLEEDTIASGEYTSKLKAADNITSEDE